MSKIKTLKSIIPLLCKRHGFEHSISDDNDEEYKQVEEYIRKAQREYAELMARFHEFKKDKCIHPVSSIEHHKVVSGFSSMGESPPSHEILKCGVCGKESKEFNHFTHYGKR